MTREEALKFIDETVKSKPVVVFMKGTADFPQCGFSGRVAQILKHFKRDFEGVNILDDDVLRQTVKEYGNWPTFPQVYLKGELVGGCDIVTEMAQSGELERLLIEKLGPVQN
jgi:monothiol glutaredoxin